MEKINNILSQTKFTQAEEKTLAPVSNSLSFELWKSRFDKTAQAFASHESDDRTYHYKEVYGHHIQHGHIITGLIHYFMGNTEEALKYGIDTRKGIRISGNTGSGKTMIMRIIQAIRLGQFGIKAGLQIVEQFNQTGDSIIKYGKNGIMAGDGKITKNHLLIDDLGKEGLGGHFSKKNRNVIAEIIDARYDHWIKYGLYTHFTDNLLDAELESEEYYGDRVAGRIFQMTNHILLGEKVDDIDFRRLSRYKQTNLNI